MNRKVHSIKLDMLLKLIILLSFIFGNCYRSIATEMEISPGVQGIWLQPNEKEPSSFTWKAQWIWLDESLNLDVLLSRKSFELKQVPKEAMLRISASSKYQLYVNRKYVCRGPARSAPHHQSYDILEISGLLQKGNNSIAVRVHHQKEKYSYQYDGRAGLLVQLDFATNQIITDSSWKVSTDKSWNNTSPKINRFQQVVNDRVDFGEFLIAWNETDFDDAHWSDARPLMRNVGWPGPQKNARAQALTPPWTSLVPRDIPYLKETNVKATNLIQSLEVDQLFSEQLKNGTKLEPIKLSRQIDDRIGNQFAEYVGNSKSLVIPSTDLPKSWLLLFDFGEVLNGMPKLDIEGAVGTSIDILCAPFLVDDQFTHQVVDSDYLDRIVLSGGRDVWEATYFKPARYMGIVVHGGSEPVRLHYAGIHHLEYPFEEIGKIHSSDAPWVQQYFDASAKTIQVCTTDGFTDNYRERRQYAQTGYYAAMGNYWIFGDIALQRRYLIQTAQEQEANGIMPAYAPPASNDYMVIMDSNCLWIRSLRNYLLYSGDYKTVNELLPAASRLMGLLSSYTNSLGMIDNPPYAYWLDHALNDRRGANFNLNGHFLGALEDYAQVLEWLDEPNAKIYKERANLLRESLQRHLWDEKRGLFADALIDGSRSEMFSEHANAMALALNIAADRQAASIVRQLLQKDDREYIRRESGIIMVTPAMSYFLHKGLCEYGYIDASFELFRSRFDKMLVSGTNGTLWEEWWLDAIGRTGKLQKGRTRSDAQTESAFPPALFAEYLLGIRPTKPGMVEVQISKKLTELENMKAAVPTPEGLLNVEWDTYKKGNELKLDVPGEMKVKLDLKSLNIPDGQQILINEQPYDLNLDSDQFYRFSKGNHTIKF